MLRSAALAACFLIVGCSSRPITDLVLADVSLKAAQKAKADSLATDYYRKAENHFLRAKQDYKDGYFDSCRRYANEARILAEKAEFRALLKQAEMKSGTVESGYDSY